MNVDELYVVVKNVYGKENYNFIELKTKKVFTLEEIKKKRIKTFDEMSELKYEANKKKLKYVAITLRMWASESYEEGFSCAYG